MLTYKRRTHPAATLLLALSVLLFGVIGTIIYLHRPEKDPPKDAVLVRAPGDMRLYNFAFPWNDTNRGITGPRRKSSG